MGYTLSDIFGSFSAYNDFLFLMLTISAMAQFGPNRLLWSLLITNTSYFIVTVLLFHRWTLNDISPVGGQVFMEILWFTGEIAITYYNYYISVALLTEKYKIHFRRFYYFFILLEFTLKLVVMVERIMWNATEGRNFDGILVNTIQIPYFVFMAIFDVICGVIIGRKFHAALSGSNYVQSSGSFFKHLLYNSEIRIGIMILVNVFRAITYSALANSTANITDTNALTASMMDFSQVSYVLVRYQPLVYLYDYLVTRKHKDVTLAASKFSAAGSSKQKSAMETTNAISTRGGDA